MIAFTPGPYPASYLTVGATITSQAVALPLGNGGSVRVINLAAADAMIAFGNSATVVTATGADRGMVIRPNADEILTVPLNATHVAVVLGTGTGDVQFVAGALNG